MRLHRFTFVALALSAALAATPAPLAAHDPGHWVGAWTSAQQLTAKGDLPPAPGLSGCTLRQVIQPTLSGDRTRVTFSNIFGHEPLAIASAHVAASAGGSAIDPRSDRTLTFDGSPTVTIEPGTSILSDAVSFPVVAQANLAVSLYLQSVPGNLTGHPGSRATSFIRTGDAVSAATFRDTGRVDHWYLLSAVDVWSNRPTAAVVVLGDSFTDGHGCTTNQNNRWTDDLARRLGPARIAVLNAGIGGNRLLRDGTGPSMLARFDRDVLAPAGVRWLIVQAGINDIGTRLEARKHGGAFASAADMILAYAQLIERAHDHGILVYGSTLPPYQGADFYWSPDGDADRQQVNRWIREGGRFDAVVDFDATLRDPHDPSRLAAKFDSGDHLHPSLGGYAEMARVAASELFAPALAAEPSATRTDR